MISIFQNIALEVLMIREFVIVGFDLNFYCEVFGLDRSSRNSGQAIYIYFNLKPSDPTTTVEQTGIDFGDEKCGPIIRPRVQPRADLSDSERLKITALPKTF